ncbi:Hypothetical protein CINCED_3A006843 [Cinara cedri]|nr:Hypothetical protein CINCED_3A006843 [Cinara cedri]
MLPRSFNKTLFPLLKHSPQHTLMFRTPINTNIVPEPYPKEYHDCWDHNHVKMPCSKHNSLIDKDNNCRKRRWDIINNALTRPITSSEELEKAILLYNLKYKERWRFHLLHSFFNECLSEEETDSFFNNLLPKIIELALKLPKLITSPIPLLKQNSSHSISFTQMQIACLLANAFLCTFPHRNVSTLHSEYSSYPQINFHELFQLRVLSSSHNCLFEKLKCIICYFKKVTTDDSDLSGIVTYSRRYLPDNMLPFWLKSNKQLTNLYITSAGTIEDDGDGMFQIDFANKFIGGGVLGHGCVQEEIRFLICPELLVSQLFSQQMLATEAIVITGVQRFSNYSGYADSFEWDGVHVDITPVDNNNRRHCTVVAIDAIYYRDPKVQFTPKSLKRELNKGYAGFSWGQNTDCSNVAIATGNWGCGAFQGDCHLKSLLQFLSAAQANRDVAYFTFGDTTLKESIHDMHTFLKNQNLTVGEICKILIKYNMYFLTHPNVGLYEYIYNAVINNDAQKCHSEEKSTQVDTNNYNQPITLEEVTTNSSPSIIEATPEKVDDNLKPNNIDMMNSCIRSILPETVLDCSNQNIIKSTPEKLEKNSQSGSINIINNSKQPIPLKAVVTSSSLNIIESTPEKHEDDSKLSTINCIIESKDNMDKQEFQDVKFLSVNQFRLRNDEERTKCIKQQKNSWLQLKDSQKDFQSVEKSSVIGPLSTLKRDREDINVKKRVKRKISDYFKKN